jgi:group I intron endonuclease
MGLIYIATNKLDGKTYVGQTSQGFEKRLAVHFCARKKSYFGNALRQRGIDGFDFEFVPCPLDELNATECSLIATIGSKYPNGYNLTDGGEGTRGYKQSAEQLKKLSILRTGRKASPETRKKLSAHMKGRQHGLGQKMTEENRRKLSERMRGTKMSEDNRQKLIKANTGNTYRKGSTMTAKTRAALLQANINRVWSDESRMKLSMAHRGKRP